MVGREQVVQVAAELEERERVASVGADEVAGHPAGRASG